MSLPKGMSVVGRSACPSACPESKSVLQPLVKVGARGQWWLWLPAGGWDEWTEEEAVP